MEVFHYVAEMLRVYPLFENGNKSIKINKERGAVYNDFDLTRQSYLVNVLVTLPIAKR